ncbi:hypothetical protein ACFE04_021198 [Oxalis oulophora]
MIGAGGGKNMKQYSNVLERPIGKGKQEVSLSAFALLFSELVQYNQTQVDNIAELERRLEDAGYAVGARVLELLCHRDKGNRRETRLLGILSFIHSTVWKVLFGKVADSLEKGTEHDDEYMISERELLVNRFISIPKDMGTFNCGAFVAGVVRGALDGAGFPAVVTAHFVPVDGQQRPRTTILIKFAEEIYLWLWLSLTSQLHFALPKKAKKNYSYQLAGSSKRSKARLTTEANFRILFTLIKNDYQLLYLFVLTILVCLISCVVENSYLALAAIAVGEITKECCMLVVFSYCQMRVD